MGRPETVDHQTEYELQPQEFHQEGEAIPEPNNFHVHQNVPQPVAPPHQYYPPPQTNQYPPPPPPPVAQHQQQPTQYPPPPQTNLQVYGPRPVQFPPQNNQTYSNGPMSNPAQPVQFPPQQNYSNGLNHKQQSPNPNMVAMQYNQNGQYQQQNNNNGEVAGFPMQSPGPQHMQGNKDQGWHSELFDCFNDPMNAVITALFPCLTFGQIAEIIDDGHTSCGTSGMLYGGIAFCIAMPCLMSCTYRTKLRNKFNLPEAPAPDWVTHFLCEWCALCQEYRELQARGWDPSIGWQGNLARNQNMQQHQVGMMPPTNQRMMG